MEDFCRTCGKTITEQSCKKSIFSPMGRRLLRSIRIITNCWVENVAGFPIYICEDCQELIKKISAFRKRCTKIEGFLSKRKTKLNTINQHSPDRGRETRTVDPLGIDETEELEPYDDIKEEAAREHPNQIEAEEPEQLSESQFDVEHDSDEYDDDLLFNDAMQDTKTNVYQEPKEDISKSQLNTDSKKRGYRKYTMRVGKRTMYIKMTDDKLPKRIVDPQRQWSTARPCICEHCGRQFKDGSNLNVHLLRHTGTKNYECKQCNEKCYTLHLLRRHQLKHTEGPYECTFCGLQYSTNSSRVRHEREACKKGRAPQSKTEIIKRGERTFHCDVCDLWFLRAGNLAQHLKSSNHTANERRKNKKYQMKQTSF